MKSQHTYITALNDCYYGSVKLRIYVRENNFAFLLRWSLYNIVAENAQVVLEPLVATVSVFRIVYTSVDEALHSVSTIRIPMASAPSPRCLAPLAYTIASAHYYAVTSNYMDLIFKFKNGTLNQKR